MGAQAWEESWTRAFKNEMLGGNGSSKVDPFYRHGG